MIAYRVEHKEAGAGWQDKFLAMLPEIESRLSYEFRDLDAGAREVVATIAVLKGVVAARSIVVNQAKMTNEVIHFTVRARGDALGHHYQPHGDNRNHTGWQSRKLRRDALYQW